MNRTDSNAVIAIDTSIFGVRIIFVVRIARAVLTANRENGGWEMDWSLADLLERRRVAVSERDQTLPMANA